MNQRFLLVATILAMLLATGAPLARAQGAPELGRLFLTPEQRNMLDARRKAKVPDKPSAAAAESPYTRVDGTVRRSGGRSTVWVDGEPVTETTRSDTAARLSPRGARGEEVSIQVGEAKDRVNLRPGETLDRTSGQVVDVIGDGKIQIKRGDAKGR